MSIKANINAESKEITVSIPLTGITGKARIKQRSMFNEYGTPLASRKEPMNQNCYIEWQIGYDIVTSEKEKLKLTSLSHLQFTGGNGKQKALYELSEYIYHFYKWEVITKEKLHAIKDFLQTTDKSQLIDVHKEYTITRDYPRENEILGIKFYTSVIKYPLLIYRFGKYEILAEITIREKQYAVGIQPMLYLCFPIAELQSATPLVGRIADAKEKSNFIISADNVSVFLEMLKIFGILSANHQTDIINIIDTILDN